MITLDELLTNLAHQINDPRGTTDPAQVQQWTDRINQAYLKVAGEYDWGELSNEATLDDSDLILPGDVLAVRSVRDGNHYFYNQVRGAHQQSAYTYNWYFAAGLTTALSSGTDASVNEYGTAVTSAASFPSTTCAGEYIRIGSNPGVYRISAWTSTSALTLADNFRGPQQSGAPFWIRPADVKTMAFSDEDGESYSPSGVVVRYTRKPLPLFQLYDLCLLPGDCAAVWTKALQYCLASLKYDRAADRREEDYQSALRLMKGQTAKPPVMGPVAMFTSTVSRSARALRDQLLGY